MKNFLLTIFAALATISSAASPILEMQEFNTNIKGSFRQPQLKQMGAVCENPPKKADETYYEVKFNFIYDDEAWTPSIMQYIMPVDGSYPYVGLCFGSDATFSVPAGTYDLLTIFTSNYDLGCTVVVRENVEIKSDSEFNFDTAEATQHIVYRPVMPDGSYMMLPDWDSEQEKFINEGNVSIADPQINILHRGWGSIYSISVMCFDNPMANTNVYTNAKEAFSFPFHVAATSPDYSECYVACLEPEGCDSQIVRNDPALYTDFSPKFAGWIVDKSEKVDIWTSGVNVRMQTADPIKENYNSSTFGVSGCTPKGYVCMHSQKEDGRNMYFSLERAVGTYNNIFNFGIIPPALSIDETEAKRCNVSHFNCMAWGMGNISSNLLYYAFQEPATKAYLIPNETFSYPYSEDMVFGNSCPLWVPAWNGSTLHYDFIGRLGDVRSVDMVNHYVSVESNDKELVTGWEELVASYGKINGLDKDAPVDIHIDNRNLKIDGEKRIRGVADLHIEPDEGKATIPVIQMLQFRNSANEPTDRFAPEGSKMLIAAGTFTDNEMCFKASELSQFSAEYAPAGSNSFENLPVVKGEEMITYGWLYTADMDAVASNEDGWYDLRLTATSANGSKMTQLISPAFKIDTTLSVKDICNNTCFDVTVVGRDIIAPSAAEIYSVSGVRCPAKSLCPGIYIVRLGDKVKKVTVR